MRFWCVLILSLVLCSCSKEEQAAVADKEHHQLNITIDPRIELLLVVQILSDYGERTPLITQYDFLYKREVLTAFAQYEDHPAVGLFRELSTYPYSFRYDAPPLAMLYLSDPPDLRVESELPDQIFARSGGERKLEQFFEQLRDFARASDFAGFFEAHRDLHARSIEAARQQVAGFDVIASLEDYFGMKQQSYNIVIVPLQSGGFGLKKGEQELYCIRGADSMAAGIPTIKGVRDICWHEFGHSFVNPVAAEYIGELQDYKPLFDPIVSRMHCGGYDDFNSYIYEHVLRAVNVRLTAIYLGEEEAHRSLQNHRSLGFVYVEALAERLKQYEAQRDKYPTFGGFFPQIVAAYAELSKTTLSDSFYAVPYNRMIMSVVSDYKDVFIVPTHESDKEAQDRIIQHVQKMRDKYHKSSSIITDEEALNQDLSNRSLLVFGTLGGNLWLDKYRDSFAFQIDDGSIIVNGIPSVGDHLKLVTARPNPKSPDKGMVIYTAQQASDIPGSYSVPEHCWWAGYVVADGEKVLVSGHYKK